jgi:hypothetical protein
VATLLKTCVQHVFSSLQRRPLQFRFGAPTRRPGPASPSSGYKTEKGKHLIFIILLQVISILFIYYKYMQRNKTVACMVTHALTCLFCMNKFYHRHDSVATAHYIQCRLGSVTVSVTSATLLSVRLGNDIMPQLTSTSQRHDQR